MSNLVELKNEQAVTTSLVVAESFGKRHDHVLQDIKKLTTENPGVRNMFEKSMYTNERNRQYPMYYINRDGFTLLAMGFTGKEALQFKLSYIEAFNAMERKLSESAPTTYIEALEKLLESEKEKERLKGEVVGLSMFIEELEPKAQYVDTILSSSDAVLVSQIAKDYGMTAQQLNSILKDEGIQRKLNGQWLLNKPYMNKGYTKSPIYTYSTSEGVGISMQTRWTQKGRLMIHDLLTSLGYIADMDKEGVL